MVAKSKTVSKKKAKDSKKMSKSKAVRYVPNLRKQYLENIAPKLTERFKYKIMIFERLFGESCIY